MLFQRWMMDGICFFHINLVVQNIGAILFLTIGKISDVSDLSCTFL